VVSVGLVVFFGLLGTLLGSFANAVALRYDPDRFMFSPATGRSHCPKCGRTLTALELVPVLSWLALRGRCYGCREKISWRYPLVELVTGLAVAAIPFGLLAASVQFLEPWRFAVAAACWVGIVLFLVVLSLVDLKHYIIPDEANVAIAVLGAVAAWATAPALTGATGSFLGSYAMLAGLRFDPVSLRLFGVAAAGGLLLLLFAITRGRGIGFGDVKLAAALGIAFAWPDSLVIVGLAFVLGTLAAIPVLVRGKKRMGSAVPFGPFLALAAVLVLAFGEDLARAYFSLLLI
jgi:prepilin signal peptidase PulO-like enzyme (type II secretory pathway)